MDLREYDRTQQSITARFAALFLRMLAPFRAPRLNEFGWASLLRNTYPEVERARRESAQLGRMFYDSQREHYVGSRHPVDLASYDFDWYVEAMEPSKKALKSPGTTDGAVSQAVLRAVKEVENGGRKTILRPVIDEDDEIRDRQVKGWARVATGRETCSFCLMLVSRGPVYFSAEDAGLDLDDTSARELIADGEDKALAEAMKRWHPGCDCKVVPVFDRRSWPGRDAYLEAEQLWIKYAKLVNDNPDMRKPMTGNQHKPMDREWTRGEAIMAALRRALESGEVNPRDFAAAA